MNIIVEGENKCGKSTLARHIVSLGFKYIKVSQPGPLGAFKEYSDILSKLEKGGDYVLDRFYIGEQVYGPIYRGSSSLSREQIMEIEKRLSQINAIVVYCYDSEKNIAKRFIKDGEEFADIKKIGEALQLFEKEIKRSILPVYRHKMNTKLDLEQTGKIDKIIKKYKNIAGV